MMVKSSSKFIFFITIALTLQLQISPALTSETAGYMQPIVRDGKYYYSESDTHKHIDLTRALSHLKRKLIFPALFSPSAWAKNLSSLFYKSSADTRSAKPKSNPIKFLEPKQSIPEKYPAQPTITWIGHATFLIQLDGFNIITDPLFGDVKVGPFSLSKRGMPAGITLEDLPPIDAIVISHNHSDHMDTPALMALNKKYAPIIFVPVGNRATVSSMGFSADRIIENTWWEQNTLTKNSPTNSKSQDPQSIHTESPDSRSIIITCLPAYHWSIRFSLGSYRESLWSSWMISSTQSTTTTAQPNFSQADTPTSDTHIYFAGDTAYGPHFKQIGEHFPSIDLALMPIGPTELGENKHKESHVDALEAVDAFIDLGAHCFVPMHYGTFFISPSTVEYPVQRLQGYWQEKFDLLSSKKLLIARCGQQYSTDRFF